MNWRSNPALGRPVAAIVRHETRTASLPQFAPKFFYCNSSEKRARKPCEMNSSKIIGLKPPLESTDPKKQGGGVYRNRNFSLASSPALRLRQPSPGDRGDGY